MQLNTMKAISNAKGKINPAYDATVNDILAIKENSPDIFVLISNAFTFGYVQGAKAEKAK